MFNELIICVPELITLLYTLDW